MEAEDSIMVPEDLDDLSGISITLRTKYPGRGLPRCVCVPARVREHRGATEQLFLLPRELWNDNCRWWWAGWVVGEAAAFWGSTLGHPWVGLLWSSQKPTGIEFQGSLPSGLGAGLEEG